MTLQLEFFYDYSCPYAYLASTQIESLAERTGAKLVYKPFLLGGVFNSLGDAAPGKAPVVPARARQNLLDMGRWAEHWGVPLDKPPGHPNRTVTALRATLCSDDVRRATHALYRAYWVQGSDLSEPTVVETALTQAGLDGKSLVARASEPAAKARLRECTDEAIARGVFGAPAMFVDGELFWGQDRLDFVEEALGGTPPMPVRTESTPAEPRASSFEFWYDFSSPFAYLGATQVERLAARSRVEVVWRPFLLGALFRSIGTSNVPISTFSPQKQKHYRADMARFAARHGLAFRFPSRFPMRTVTALRLALAAGDDIGSLSLEIFRAYWEQDRDIDDDEELRACCRAAGVDPALLARTNDDSIKLALRDATETAERRGLCGAPSYVVGEHVFWGQDRAGFVEKALAG